MRPFCRKNPVHKIPRFRGGGILGLGGGGECRFYFYGRADFSDLCSDAVNDSPEFSYVLADPPPLHTNWSSKGDFLTRSG